MAQHVWKKAAEGTGIDGVVGAADATVIGTDDLWVIVASGISRDVTIANLRDVIAKLEAGNTTFPAA